MNEYNPGNQYNQLPLPSEMIQDVTSAVESNRWPIEFFATLLGPVERWAAEHPTTYHHVGYTYPNKAAFAAATEGSPNELIANNLQVGTTVHQRKYLRRPSAVGADTYVEHHMVGDEGNGTEGVHFDFVTDDTEGFLAFLEQEASASKGADVDLVTQPFGGGNAPVGKVELRPADNPKLSVGVMVRTHWSNPAEW